MVYGIPYSEKKHQIKKHKEDMDMVLIKLMDNESGIMSCQCVLLSDQVVLNRGDSCIL